MAQRDCKVSVRSFSSHIAPNFNLPFFVHICAAPASSHLPISTGGKSVYVLGILDISSGQSKLYNDGSNR
eukprot:CAMPEP_0183832120 /NCGR_PEP_ID=MMETSP0807_2-20130328/5176_1 /TAXON_ID=88271 /ORGANISM="Picocystis salinarum, Strain CCMP1897" /LENGTH=69 /DNA_ID=CAMNT_0026077749 /DNA_START=869 /DNA_END=1078 /DNA_ORIENTATION=-